MPTIVLCLHAHLPLRLRKYGFFDIGRSEDYFDMEQSRQALENAARDSYLQVNETLLKLIRRHRGGFRVSCSVSGMLLEQLETGQKAVLESFRRLADTGCTEFAGGPWHHSLASFFSEEEFRKQIALHKRKHRALFGQAPRAFRNTELLYENNVARIAESMGFRVILAGAAGRPPGCNAETLCRPAGCRRIKVLFRNDRFPDPVALQASTAGGKATAADEWIRMFMAVYREDEVINLFMDYETFVERDPGINGMPGFLERLTEVSLKQSNWRFSTPSDVAEGHAPAGEIDAPDPVFPSGPGRERSAWLGNHMQHDAVRALYRLEGQVLATKNRKWIGTWRNLQASDYFHDMRTVGHSAESAHRVENPFGSPYDAYIHYMSILKDFSGRIAGKTGVRP